MKAKSNHFIAPGLSKNKENYFFKIVELKKKMRKFISAKFRSVFVLRIDQI